MRARTAELFSSLPRILSKDAVVIRAGIEAWGAEKRGTIERPFRLAHTLLAAYAVYFPKKVSCGLITASRGCQRTRDRGR